MFGTDIGGLHFLCPRLKLQMYLLVSRLIISGAGWGGGNTECKGHATSTSPGETTHSVRAVPLPWQRPHMGTLPTFMCPLAQGLPLGGPGGSGEVPRHNCPGIGFSAPRIPARLGASFVLPIAAEAQRSNPPC